MAKSPGRAADPCAVCVAAATFGILTIEIVHAPMFAGDAMKEMVKVDPVRVVEAVTAGVAFLAAGSILFARGEVQGLTTGAGMWLAGAIGAGRWSRLLADRRLRHVPGADRARPVCMRSKEI